MKIIKPSVKEIIQESGIDGMYRAIEVAGRNCYKSEDKICDGSAEKLIENFKKRKHGSPMEFGTVYLTVPTKEASIVLFYSHNKFSKVFSDGKNSYITTNYRVIIENNRDEDLQYMSEPTENHEKRRFFRIICDRALLAEFTRHRVFSFCVESQRYCNYSKDQFSNEITFIEPCWCYDNEDSKEYEIWKNACDRAESSYFDLIIAGWRPEQARAVLPNSTKTDICMCGFESDWLHFLELRQSGAAHPQAREVADEIRLLFDHIC